MRCAQLRHGLIMLRARLIERDLIVARVQFHQERPGLDTLVVIHVDGPDSAIDARRDGVQVSVDLCVIRVFETSTVEVPADSGGQQHQNDPADQEGIHEAARLGGLENVSIRRDSCGGLRSLGICLCIHAHLLTPFE